jgi:hypothetical protein
MRSYFGHYAKRLTASIEILPNNLVTFGHDDDLVKHKYERFCKFHIIISLASQHTQSLSIETRFMTEHSFSTQASKTTIANCPCMAL